MLNSIKQIYRTPVKLVLFIIAMIVSSMILVLGIVLLLYTNLVVLIISCILCS